MGMWGTALYANDTSADVKGDLSVLLMLPWEADRLVQAVIDRYPSALDHTDGDYPDVWLALADQLHAHGITHAATVERVRQIVEGGIDIRLKREAGLSAKDTAKRENVLAEALARLATPHPKPRRRKVLKSPEPQAFSAGDILCYPTEGGLPINPHFSEKDIAEEFKPDGWGSAIVLETGAFEGYIGWTCAARLGVHGKKKPTFDRCLESGIENQPHWLNPTGAGSTAGALGALAPKHAQRMRIERLGTAALDMAEVREKFPSLLDPPKPPYPVISTVFQWWSKDVAKRQEEHGEMDAPTIVLPLTDLIAR